MKNFIKFLKTDVKLINSYFLLAIILVILICVGYTSYALFSFSKVSNNIIELGVGKIQDPNIEPQTFNYVEGTEYYTYVARANGYYNLDVYGAQGGSYNESYAAGGLGGYSTGIVKLNKGDILYVYVGGKGSYGTSTTITVTNGGGYNGGGNAAYRGGAGGGASDIRYFSSTPTTTELKWNSEKGLNSRLIVAGGGGGAYAYSSSYKAAGGAGGGTTGGDGSYYSSSYTNFIGHGGTQTAGGSDGTGIPSTNPYTGTSGTFGTGGNTGQTYSTSYYSNGAGGGGFYGGGGADNYTSSRTRASGGGGGSGYVWTSATASNYTTSTLPTSMYLTNAKTEQGTNSGNGKVTISYISKNKPTGADILVSLTNNVNDSGLYTITHEADSTLQIGATSTVTEYRYQDTNSKNYVTFNNEVWRIIGVFPTDDGNGKIENRIKIIKNESIGHYDWNNTEVTNTHTFNNWTGASLKTYLNGTYYNGLTSEAQNMIGQAKYYLGGYIYSYTVSGSNMTSNEMYLYERKISGSDYFIANNPNSWVGNIALIYGSDYNYILYWMKMLNGWVITPSVAKEGTGIYSNGVVTHAIISYKAQMDMTLVADSVTTEDGETIDIRGLGAQAAGDKVVFPSLYLKASVQITGGTGTSSDPYTLGL